jgi:oleandomycin transport system ATP-binding protein
VTGDGVLAGVAAALAAAGIELTELALQLPSLDEVFHTLTTHDASHAPVRPKELV